MRSAYISCSDTDGMLFRRNKGSVGCAFETCAKIITEDSPGRRGKWDWSLRSKQQPHGPCGCMASLSTAASCPAARVHGLYVYCTLMAPGGTWPLCLLQPHGRRGHVAALSIIWENSCLALVLGWWARTECGASLDKCRSILHDA